MTRVVVTGASGTLGRRLVPRLLARGHEVVAVSRRPRAADRGERWVVADVRSGAGLTAALDGADAVVHCATGLGDEAAAQVLLAHADRGTHVVYISIVGVDRVPMPYYRAKLAAERVLADSGRPVTIQRATQFHELVRGVFRAQSRLPVLLVPSRTAVQPVDAGEVAQRLAELAGRPAIGRAADLGGPRVETVADLARQFLEAAGRTRRVVGVRLPGRTGRAFRDGGHLTADHADGTVGFAQFLTDHGAERDRS